MSEGEKGAVIAEGYYLNSVMVHCSGEECQGYILLTANVLGDNQKLDQISLVRDFFWRCSWKIFLSFHLKERLNLQLNWCREPDQC